MNAKQKKRQFDHQRGLCCWCLEPMNFTRGNKDPKGATKEHIIPRALGGNDALINLALAHRDCNQKRGSRIGTPHFRSYRLLLQARIQAPMADAVIGL